MALMGKEKFSPGEIERIYEYLTVYKERGNPIQFEIIVDNFKAVRRTEDLEMFQVYEKFIKPSTKSIEIILYTGNSNNNDKYILTFEEQASDKGLSGLEVEGRIREGIENEKRSWEQRLLEKENKDLKTEISENEKLIRELENEVEKLEKERLEMVSKESPLKGILGDIGSGMLESFIRRNPKTIARIIPGGEALSGLVDEDVRNRESVSSEGENSSVSFKPAGETSEDKQAVEFLKELNNSFSETEIDKVMDILFSLKEDKTKIEPVLSLLEN